MTFSDKPNIKITQKPDGLHVFLKGNFNASIANQVLCYMRAYHDQVPSIYVHTEDVTSFENLGLSIFSQGIGSLKNEFSGFKITGEMGPFKDTYRLIH